MNKFENDSLLNFIYFLVFPSVFIALLVIMLQCCSHLTPAEKSNLETVAEDVVETIIKDEYDQFNNTKKFA